jgi:hypothetical protein
VIPCCAWFKPQPINHDRLKRNQKVSPNKLNIRADAPSCARALLIFAIGPNNGEGRRGRIRTDVSIRSSSLMLDDGVAAMTAIRA